MSSWKEFKGNQLYVVLFPLLINGCMFILFGLSTWLLASSLFSLFRMVFGVFVSSYKAAIWQRNVPPEVQGHVFGVKKFILSFAPPLGFAISGFLGAKIETNWGFILLGSVLVLYVWMQFFNKQLIALGKWHQQQDKKTLAITNSFLQKSTDFID